MSTQYAAVHESPNGPGDVRPTAQQIIADQQLEGKWSGRVILITGCSSGLGIETARALLSTGATLYLTARDISKAKSALGTITSNDHVHLLKLDLNSLASVRKCAEDFLSMSKRLDILIANAGVMSTPEGRTVDGFETQFGVNHLSHFLLINLLTPTLLASSSAESNSRVVILSSIAHRSGEVNFSNINLDGEYNSWVSYAQSKTACLWHANHLERLYGSNGLHAWSVQPGGVQTGLLQYLSEEEKAGLGGDPSLAKIFKNVEQGAATSVWAATASALEGHGGKYLEDCQIAKKWEEDGQWASGYAKHAYDETKERRLWQASLKMAGLDV